MRAAVADLPVRCERWQARLSSQGCADRQHTAGCACAAAVSLPPSPAAAALRRRMETGAISLGCKRAAVNMAFESVEGLRAYHAKGGAATQRGRRDAGALRPWVRR